MRLILLRANTITERAEQTAEINAAFVAASTELKIFCFWLN